MRKTSKFLVNTFLCVLLFCTGCGLRSDVKLLHSDSSSEGASVSRENSEGGKTEEKAGKDETKESASAMIHVFVCGAVLKEGVYELPEGSRVYEAVECAGGFREDADTSYINQAAVLQDAQKLEIPTREEAERYRENGVALNQFGTGNTGTAGSMPAGGSASKVNINTADEVLLRSIPGIGAVKAKRIIEYRNENGLFGSIEELMNVSGIGEASLRNIQNYITVENENTG